MTSGAKRNRRRLARVLTAGALCALALAGCSGSGEGVRDEGPSEISTARHLAVDRWNRPLTGREPRSEIFSSRVSSTPSSHGVYGVSDQQSRQAHQWG